MIYLSIIAGFLLIGIASFGGGMVAIGLIIHEVVTVRGWLDADEMARMITLSQMTPGPIGINTATYTGYKIVGIPGALAATAAVVLPGIVLLVIAGIVKKRVLEIPGNPLAARMPRIARALKPGIWALLLQAVIGFSRASLTSWYAAAVFAVSLCLFLFVKKIHPLVVIFAAGVLGILVL